MDPDGDYEGRHSIRSTASDHIINPTRTSVDEFASPSKIFAPDDDTKLPAKLLIGQDTYDGPTAPPMEDVADANAYTHQSAMEPRGTAYDDMMSGKMDLPDDQAPISNSVAVPIGFDSDDMALPEAKALPIVGSTAHEGTNVLSATLEQDPTGDTEAQINEEEPNPVPVPFSSDEDRSPADPDATSERGSDEQSEIDVKVPSPRRCSRKQKLCCVALAFVVIVGTALGVLFGSRKGQMILLGYPNCKAPYPDYIGDGDCDGSEYFNAECGWDGGDCHVPGYPDCVGNADEIGDGRCQGHYNIAECGWDGGDCEEFNSKYPNCDVRTISWINDGYCDDGDYKSADCGWDGGDCLFDKEDNKACTGTIGSTWAYQNRAWCQYKCMDEGVECEAYDYNSDTYNCRLYSSYVSTRSKNNRNCWKKKKSALAAEDITEKLEACVTGDTTNVNMRCIQGVFSTLDPDMIGKLAQCAGEDSIGEMHACVEEQLSN